MDLEVIVIQTFQMAKMADHQHMFTTTNQLIPIIGLWTVYQLNNVALKTNVDILYLMHT